MSVYSFIAKDNGVPVYRQLQQALTDDIKSGKYDNMQKLPSRRRLARELGLSTTTINNAYQALVDDGYAVTVDRSGFYVKAPDISAEIYDDVKWEANADYKYNFSYNNCESAAFKEYCARPAEKFIRDSGGIASSFFGHGNKRGESAFRISLSKYLSETRGIDCTIGDIIVGAGIQYLLTVIVMILGRDRVYGFENPTDYKMYVWLKNLGADIKLLNISAEKPVTPAALDEARIDVMFLMPENQLPTGRRMELKERRALAEWCASGKGKYVIEVASDGNLNYAGKKISTIYTLSGGANVIYVESLEHTIASNVKTSFMVMPPESMDSVIKRLEMYSPSVTIYEQLLYSNLINDGHLRRLISKNNKLMKEKRDFLISGLKSSKLGERFTALNADAGMNFLGMIQSEKSGPELTRAAYDEGVKIFEMSKFLLAPNPGIERGAFVFGYAGLNLAEIEDAIKKLEKAW